MVLSKIKCASPFPWKIILKINKLFHHKVANISLHYEIPLILSSSIDVKNKLSDTRCNMHDGKKRCELFRS